MSSQNLGFRVFGGCCLNFFPFLTPCYPVLLLLTAIVEKALSRLHCRRHSNGTAPAHPPYPFDLGFRGLSRFEPGFNRTPAAASPAAFPVAIVGSTVPFPFFLYVEPMTRISSFGALFPLLRPCSFSRHHHHRHSHWLPSSQSLSLSFAAQGRGRTRVLGWSQIREDREDRVRRSRKRNGEMRESGVRVNREGVITPPFVLFYLLNTTIFKPKQIIIFSL